MTGKITATSGEIGGFGISDNSVSSSNNNIILRDSGQLTALISYSQEVELHLV